VGAFAPAGRYVEKRIYLWIEKRGRLGILIAAVESQAEKLRIGMVFQGPIMARPSATKQEPNALAEATTTEQALGNGLTFMLKYRSLKREGNSNCSRGGNRSPSSIV
jgi:hypothetical protein